MIRVSMSSTDLEAMTRRMREEMEEDLEYYRHTLINRFGGSFKRKYRISDVVVGDEEKTCRIDSARMPSDHEPWETALALTIDNIERTGSKSFSHKYHIALSKKQWRVLRDMISTDILGEDVHYGKIAKAAKGSGTARRKLIR